MKTSIQKVKLMSQPLMLNQLIQTSEYFDDKFVKYP